MPEEENGGSCLHCGEDVSLRAPMALNGGLDTLLFFGLLVSICAVLSPRPGTNLVWWVVGCYTVLQVAPMLVLLSAGHRAFDLHTKTVALCQHCGSLRISGPQGKTARRSFRALQSTVAFAGLPVFCAFAFFLAVTPAAFLSASPSALVSSWILGILTVALYALRRVRLLLCLPGSKLWPLPGRS
jgi:hypothetical protein